jgi:hypothetical protein
MFQSKPFRASTVLTAVKALAVERAAARVARANFILMPLVLLSKVTMDNIRREYGIAQVKSLPGMVSPSSDGRKTRQGEKARDT